MINFVTDSHLLFVYGTLMRNAHNAHNPQAQYLHQAATFLGSAHWQGRLYLVSHYPGAVPSELAYASLNLSNRSSEMDETVFYSMSQESIKPAYLRRKVVKGRSTESQ